MPTLFQGVHKKKYLKPSSIIIMYNQAKGFQNKAQENQKNGLLKFY